MPTNQPSPASQEARVAIEPGFSWDGQDAYLFDIDGTLLRSRDRIHFNSFATSVQRVTGFEITLAGILLHGSTDTAILREACLQAGVPADVMEQRTEAILEAMRNVVAEQRYQLDLIRMPGVETVLNYLAGKGALLGVATGNLEAIGWIKIEQAGLREWFRFGGFSDHFSIRPELIGHAARKAREMAGKEASVCVVGDTPRDIEAARANYLPVIAVATGNYSFDELQKLQPEACVVVAGRPADVHADGVVRRQNPNAVFRAGRARVFSALALALFALASTFSRAQTAAAQPDAASAQSATSQNKQPRESDRRRAAKLYLAASKPFMDEQFEDAQRMYEEAAKLDPENANYRLAAEVARSHAVTALIQSAAKSRLRGDEPGARAALARALELDPRNIEATEHLDELGDEAVRGLPRPLYERTAGTVGVVAPLAPQAGLHSFHIRAGERAIIEQVFKAFGIVATTDDSIESTEIRFDIDEANFEDTTRALALATNSFYVPLDAHHVLAARDTRTNRAEFTRLEMETVFLAGMKAEEMTEVSNLAKQVFGVQQVQLMPSTETITIRAPRDTLEAFNSTISELIDGHSQVLLDVRLIQLAHMNARNTGVTPPQTFSAFNVYAEEQSLLTSNQALVQQIISSGLAAPGDTLAILGILLASGQVSSSLFSNGVALFGGGLTQSALAPGGATANFNLNSSDSRELDQIQLRLGDGEPGNLKEGERYPIQTSSFSSLSASVPNIPGLTGAGASGSLSSILSSLQGGVPSVPQVEYQDLGLTLKATANVMRDKDVALTIDMKITALSGAAINGNPILNSRAYSGVVTIKEGSAVVVASELDKSESRNISGTPGLSEIPGLNNLTDKDVQKNFATLLIVITPHVIRGTQGSGRSPMIRVERSTSTQ